MLLRDIDKKGYVLLRNVIPLEDIKEARKYITKDKVLYGKLENYIDDVIVGTVSDKLGTDLVNCKYRVSNKDNANDAAAYHRDLQIHANDYEKKVPVYTVLNYLDGGNMELIPGSDDYPHMSIPEMFKFYGKSKVLTLGPTDILVFRATLLHRGLFFIPQENRRLIQCFDCIPRDKLEKLNSEILHTACINKCISSFENFMIKLSKNKVLINLLTGMNFYNVAGGYGYKEYDVLRKLHGDKYKYISTEANNPRIDHNRENYSFIPDGWGTINRYVPRFELNDQSEEDENMIKFYTLVVNNLIVLVIVFMLVCLVVGLALYGCFRKRR
jgi:hypothetical protein